MKVPRIKIRIFGFGFKPFRADEITLIKNLGKIYIFKGSLRSLLRNEMYRGIQGDLDHKLVVVSSKGELLTSIERDMIELTEREVGVFSSGDPFIYGIAEEIRRAFPYAEVSIFPDLSSLQILCARLKIPFTCVKAISFHGRPLEVKILLREILENRYVAIFTDSNNSPGTISRVLRDKGFKELKIFVGEHLGALDEKIHEGSADDLAERTFNEPNLMIIENPNWGKFSLLGRHTVEYVHLRGLITKDEVRAVVLHKLSPPRRGVIWDVGAGSGSVSIELALLSKDLEIFAIERDLEQVRLIEKNAEKFSAPNIKVIHGEAPSIFDGLPKPDRVFLGGSGGRLLEILEYICTKVEPEIFVATFVVFRHLQLAHEYLKKYSSVDITQIQINRANFLNENFYLKAENPVFLLRAKFKK